AEPVVEVDHRESGVAYHLSDDQMVAVIPLPLAGHAPPILPEALAAILCLRPPCPAVEPVPSQRSPLEAIRKISALRHQYRFGEACRAQPRALAPAPHYGEVDTVTRLVVEVAHTDPVPSE